MWSPRLLNFELINNSNIINTVEWNFFFFFVRLRLVTPKLKLNLRKFRALYLSLLVKKNHILINLIIKIITKRNGGATVAKPIRTMSAKLWCIMV